MKIIHHYISKTVIGMTLLVLLMVAGLETLIAFLNELDDINRYGYGIKQATVYVFSSLPSMLYPLFPAVALMGCLMGLGRLATQSELIVIQASGVSKDQIAFSVMRAIIGMLLVVTFVGEGLAPKAQHFAESYKMQAQTGNVIIGDRQGLWVHDSNNFIHIEKIVSNNQLQSISRYQFDGTKLILASTAREGHYEQGHWVFSDIKESAFLPEHIKVQKIDKQIWPVYLDPDFIGIADINPDQASLLQLNRYIHYLHKSGLYAQSYKFEFWKRIFQPLAALVMVGLAIPFIFGPLRTKPMGFRILIGIMIGFGFYTFNEFIGPFSLLYQVPPLVSAGVPLLAFAIFDFVLLRGTP